MSSTRGEGIAAAFALLTVAPVPPRSVGGGGLARAVKWFPLAGIVVGCFVGATGWLLRWFADYLTASGLVGGAVGDSSLHMVVSVLIGFVMVFANFAFTRGMHWDGLADVADAWWGGYTPSRRLEIMSDSSLGTFGVFALLLVFASLLLGYSAATATLWVVPVAAMIGRLSAVFGAQLGQPAKPDGLGAQTAESADPETSRLWARLGNPVTWAVAVVTTVVGVTAFVFLSGAPVVPTLIVLMVATVAAAGFPHFIALRMGGITGDVLGASILLTEIVTVWLLLAVA